MAKIEALDFAQFEMKTIYRTSRSWSSKFMFPTVLCIFPQGASRNPLAALHTLMFGVGVKDGAFAFHHKFAVEVGLQFREEILGIYQEDIARMEDLVNRVQSLPASGAAVDYVRRGIALYRSRVQVLQGLMSHENMASL